MNDINKLDPWLEAAQNTETVMKFLQEAWHPIDQAILRNAPDEIAQTRASRR